jgi:hypothetical protein
LLSNKQNIAFILSNCKRQWSKNELSWHCARIKYKWNQILLIYCFFNGSMISISIHLYYNTKQLFQCTVVVWFQQQIKQNKVSHINLIMNKHLMGVIFYLNLFTSTLCVLCIMPPFFFLILTYIMNINLEWKCCQFLLSFTFEVTCHKEIRK